MSSHQLKRSRSDYQDFTFYLNNVESLTHIDHENDGRPGGLKRFRSEGEGSPTALTNSLFNSPDHSCQNLKYVEHQVPFESHFLPPQRLFVRRCLISQGACTSSPTTANPQIHPGKTFCHFLWTAQSIPASGSATRAGLCGPRNCTNAF